MEQKKNFWERIKAALYRLNEKDTDTVLYTLMCLFTIPALLLCGVFLWMSGNDATAKLRECTFRRVFGIYCPGCGGTRAIRALLHGDLVAALYYHPAAVYGIFLYLVYFVSQTVMRLSRGKVRGMQFRAAYLYVMLALMGINFVVRNVLLRVFQIPTL